MLYIVQTAGYSPQMAPIYADLLTSPPQEGLGEAFICP